MLELGPSLRYTREEIEEVSTITLGDPYKTRLIAQAQIKTDKLDARKLAQLLRGNFINSVHIPTRSTLQRRNVRAKGSSGSNSAGRVRNRVHTLLERQRSISLLASQ